MVNPSGVDFCLPLHHEPQGPTDPSKTKLSSPFVVVVVGGSRGIGLGIAQAYATAGASGIVLSGRTLSTLEDAARSVFKINPRAKILCQEGDICKEEEVKSLVEATEKAFGRLDVLIINAGASTKLTEVRNDLKNWPSGFIEGPPSELERLWKLHVNAPYLLMHHFLPLLESTRDGAQAIIQVSSAAAHYTNADLMPVSYSLTKFSCTRMIELCHEGHHKNGVVAYAIQPGGVKTDMAGSIPEGKGWENRLIDDVGLAGGFCVWLTKKKRDWLSGRYLDSRWDIEELLNQKEDILSKDLLKLRLAL
jgi:NAD(P)-dependent dehydrogenase (short-subunit alcohol dehydrogenase family)